MNKIIYLLDEPEINEKYSQWEIAIWFDMKHETYLLPLKAEIREKENIEVDKEVEVSVWA